MKGSRMEGAAMVSLDRTSSIENEPRTLNIEQLQLAREAALYVLSTRSVDEALRIFTKGMEPVMNCVKDNKATMTDYDNYEDLEGLPNQLRDIVTAPF